MALLAAGISAAADELNVDQRRRLTGFMQGVLDGRLYHTSVHLAGGVLRHEITPLLNGSLAGIVSLSDGSFTLQPGLVYSAADEVDVIAGALLSFGEKPTGTPEFCQSIGGCPASEFGTFPRVVYVQSKVYF